MCELNSVKLVCYSEVILPNNNEVNDYFSYYKKIIKKCVKAIIFKISVVV